MASSASIVHASFAVAFLFATTAVAGSDAAMAIDTTAKALFRSTEALPAAAAHNGSHQYTCYLCHKRSSLMIRRCPIARDNCHLNCLNLPTPAPPSPPRMVAGGDRNADDCYIMKVYPDGSWVVVDVVGCKATTAACYLVCGNGDERGGDGAAGTTIAATPRGPLPHGLPEFERCGDHLTARAAAVAGV